MKIDFSRLFVFLLICLVGQYVIQWAVVSVFSVFGWYDPLAMLFIVDILIGFLFAYLYYPSELRRGIFKNPNYYKDSGTFALVLVVIDLIRMFL